MLRGFVGALCFSFCDYAFFPHENQLMTETGTGNWNLFLSLSFLLHVTVTGSSYFFSAALLPVPIVFRILPRRVRELVFVRCPRTGSSLVCRTPRYAFISFTRFTFADTSRFRSPSILYFSTACRMAFS